MKIPKKFMDCRLAGASRYKRTAPLNPLREFVYLDEVSVYSLLASLEDGIATEIMEHQSAYVDNTAGASIGTGVGQGGANIGASFRAGQSHGTQIFRKSIIQTHFGRLFRLVERRLALSPISDRVPGKGEDHAHAKALEDQLISMRKLRRGDLIEVELELEADPIYQMAAVVASMLEFTEYSDQILGDEISRQILQARPVSRALNGLLAGLVPIKGRLVGHKYVTTPGAEGEIRTSKRRDLELELKQFEYPLYVVGVADKDLFWKDLRRLLFSKSRFRAFCRIEKDGIVDDWQPIKSLGALTEISDEFSRVMRRFSNLARATLSDAKTAGRAAEGQSPSSTMWTELPSLYARSLAAQNELEVDEQVFVQIVEECDLEDEWWIAESARRSRLNLLREVCDRHFGTDTSINCAARIRSEIFGSDSLANGRLPASSNGAVSSEVSSREKYLDVEFVAIYW